jgi:MFS family permease
VTFNCLALVGYGLYLVSPSWPFVFVGLACTMAWSSLALPATFALIGDSLPPERRAMGFTVQSILKRLPIVLAPPLGGLLIGSLGLVAGVHLGLIITLVLGTFSLLAQHRFWRVLNSGGHEPSDDPMARKQLSCLSITRHCRVAHIDHGVLDIRVP